MSKDPILAAKVIAPARDGSWPRVPLAFKVYGGLHYLKGNKAPYFSLTYWSHRKGFPNQCQSGGAGHDEIARRFPGRFDDLAALHLADINGEPMHAVENGSYWLAGYFGGLGAKFHGGNSKGHHGGEYREPTRAECLDTFARMWRITREDAEEIARECRSRAGDNRERFTARLADHAAMMRPRWKEEADAAISRHKLTVYGDAWQAEAA